jgi:hypothetical protein
VRIGNLVAALCVILAVAASTNRDGWRRHLIELLAFGDKAVTKRGGAGRVGWQVR